MPLTPDLVREALARHAAAVAVVAAADAGVYRGLTATSLIPVSLEPPLLLVSLDALSQTAELVVAAGGFTVSLLTREQEFLAERFAGSAPPAPPRWTGFQHHLTESGRPVLGGALAWFDCTVERTVEVADHQLVLGRVIGADAGRGDPLVWWDKQAWTLA